MALDWSRKKLRLTTRTEPGIRGAMLITASSTRLLRTCPRAYELRHECKLAPRHYDAPALRMGTAVHACLEAYWRAPVDGRVDAIREALAAPECSALPADELAMVEAMSLGYAARWELDGLEALAVEVAYEAPVVASGKRIRGARRAGKIDAIVRDVRGDVWVMEHKTTSQDIAPGSPYFERLAVDLQCSHYVLGARALGYDVRGVLYDVLRKPKLARKLATPVDQSRYTAAGALYESQRESDESAEDYRSRLLESIAGDVSAYYARTYVARLEDELELVAREDAITVEQIRRYRRLQVWPRHDQSCTRYGTRCEYMPICTGAIGSDQIADHYETKAPHSELGQKKTDAQTI